MAQGQGHGGDRGRSGGGGRDDRRGGQRRDARSHRPADPKGHKGGRREGPQKGSGAKGGRAGQPPRGKPRDEGHGDRDRRDGGDGGRRWRDEGKPGKGPRDRRSQPRQDERRTPRRLETASHPKPDFPDGSRASIPKGVEKELRRFAGPDRVDDIALALTLGSEAIDEGEPELARRYLEWAKDQAPRSPSLREALGIARYLDEDYSGAVTELKAYKRMTGRTDQNHVLADCARATGKPTSDIASYVNEMVDRDAKEPLVVEGHIVWASALADAGDPGAGRAVLRRMLEGRGLAKAEKVREHHLRLWYVAGDLAERAGDQREAKRWFEQVKAEEPDAFDVAERLAALEG